MYESIVKDIVCKHGGFREKFILENPYIIEKSGTWNDEHKVLNILKLNPDMDDFRYYGFQIDLVTKSICVMNQAKFISHGHPPRKIHSPHPLQSESFCRCPDSR